MGGRGGKKRGGGGGGASLVCRERADRDTGNIDEVVEVDLEVLNVGEVHSLRDR